MATHGKVKSSSNSPLSLTAGSKGKCQVWVSMGHTPTLPCVGTGALRFVQCCHMGLRKMSILLCALHHIGLELLHIFPSLSRARKWVLCASGKVGGDLFTLLCMGQGKDPFKEGFAP